MSTTDSTCPLRMGTHPWRFRIVCGEQYINGSRREVHVDQGDHTATVEYDGNPMQLVANVVSAVRGIAQLEGWMPDPGLSNNVTTLPSPIRPFLLEPPAEPGESP